MFGFCKMHDVKVPSLRSGAVKLKKKGDVCIMKLSGKLDLYNVYKVKNLYSELVNKGISSFVLDAGKMNYMDNSGLGGLLYMVSDLKGRGGKMSVCRLKGSAKSMVQMTCLSKAFLMSNSVKESIRLVKGQ